ncbi:phosphopyruvate hydratase [Candidatus Profftella armatura]|uniref:phosphopyruvate hydratase n=1 Tax=Candidatus Profftella armatura TaxID=669502 RepID=UPI003D99B7CE
MSAIVDIIGREIIDSQGFPAIECDILLESGILGRASISSKFLIKKNETLESCKYINTEISEAIMGFSSNEQFFLDYTLTNLSKNKSQFIKNALLSVSIAIAKASSNELGLPLYRYISGSREISIPVPIFGITNTNNKICFNELGIKEFMIIPIGASSFKEAIHYGIKVIKIFKKILFIKKNIKNKFSYDHKNLEKTEKIIKYILQAIKKSGYEAGKQIAIGLDFSSNKYYKNNFYQLNENLKLNSIQMINLLISLCNKYPIISIKDGIAENDLEGKKYLNKELKNKIQLIGKNLFFNNNKIFLKNMKKNINNSILIKLNHYNTLTEILKNIEKIKKFGYNIIISCDINTTEDSSIIDITLGANASQIKINSIFFQENIIKYNQLLRIEEDLGEFYNYSGKNIFSI